MAFPNKVDVKALDAEGREYDKCKLESYWALYAGGEFFRALEDKFIIKREIERNNTKFGIRSYEERKKFAAYMNRIGGFIDGSVAEITKDGVYIKVEGGTEEQREYYESLNYNVDGSNTPFAQMVRKLLADEMISRDAWISSRVDPENPRHFYISRLNPVKVIDWVVQENDSALLYAKVKRVTEYREVEYMPSKLMLCEWFLFDGKSAAVYEALYDGVRYVDTDGNAVQEATLREEISTEDFGMPIQKVCADRSQWVVDRVADTIVLLFNKELDHSFALAEAAYPQLVFNVENRNNLSDIIKSEINAIVLEEGDKVQYLSPNRDAFEPMRENIERLKGSIHEVIQTMARDAASIPQAGRMSGETVREIRGPQEALKMSFAWPVYEALMSMLNKIKDFRTDDEISLDIVGLIDNNDHKLIEDESEIDDQENDRGEDD